MVKRKKTKTGFSLAENLTVLFVLGVIIAITIPRLLANRSARNNMLLVRKTVATYQGILDREITSATGVRTTAGLNNRLVNCNAIRDQLKVRRVITNCDFVTEDGARWNLEISPSEAVISIKESVAPTYANAQDDNNDVFYVPFAVNRREVRVLEFDNAVNNQLQNRANALNKTRRFIIGE